MKKLPVVLIIFVETKSIIDMEKSRGEKSNMPIYDEVFDRRLHNSEECGNFSKVYESFKPKKHIDGGGFKFGKIVVYGTCGEIPGYTGKDIFDEIDK